MKPSVRFIVMLAISIFFMQMASTKPAEFKAEETVSAFSTSHEDECLHSPISKTVLEKRDGDKAVLALLLMLIYIISKIPFPAPAPSRGNQILGQGSQGTFFRKVHIMPLETRLTLDAFPHGYFPPPYEIDTILLQQCLMRGLGERFWLIPTIVNSFDRDPRRLQHTLDIIRLGRPLTPDSATEAIGPGVHTDIKEHFYQVLHGCLDQQLPQDAVHLFF